MSYQQPRNTRREFPTFTDRFRAGKLVPVAAVPVQQSEGGLLSQNIMIELDPIAGRMITPMTAELVSVFAPVQAMLQLLDPDDPTAGLTDIARVKLLSGNPLFDLEEEGEITKYCGIIPMAHGEERLTCKITRLAHNAAVNHLRLEKYHLANLLTHANTAVTPALLGTTILERFNGVLDPDDKINGAVTLDLPEVIMPVEQLYRTTDDAPSGTYLQTDTSEPSGLPGSSLRAVYMAPGGDSFGAAPKVIFQGQEAGSVSLKDFYDAEKMDKLTRAMDQMVRDNPQHGHEMVVRWAHGLSIDTGKDCFVVARQERIFGRDIVDAMDSAGVLAETLRSDMAVQMGFTVPIPRTELGGMIITFATVRPDETIMDQPHPILSYPWGLINHVADEFATDPVPVLMRELDANLETGQGNISMYTGLNELKRNYAPYGFTRRVDLDTVESKTMMWQLRLPLSVTPNTILYPDDLDHYPFADQEAAVCRYTMTTNASIRTPMQFGPTPVEDIGTLENLFTKEIEIVEDL